MATVIRLPLLVQDRHHLLNLEGARPPEVLLATPIQEFSTQDDGTFRDGPSCSRVAVQSIAAGGSVGTVVRFLPQGVGRTVSCYDVGDTPDLNNTRALIKALESETFMQISAFATVLKTMRFFEGPDALGRKLKWAFSSPRLRVLLHTEPSEGPFYDRDSGSLQFFPYPSNRGQTLHTALSFDILVHETTHAILDGIAPDLYHATRTESLALHEAIADLAAILLTVLNEMVVFSLVNISSSQLDVAGALGKLAEELGQEMRGKLGIDYVRALKNKRNLDPVFTDLADPYGVSEAMSGAIFQTFVDCANGLQVGDDPRQCIEAPEEKRILRAGRKIARMVFRALDYLPPGEVSLADFGRAMFAADRARHSRLGRELHSLAREMKKRRIVRSEEELETRQDAVGRGLNGVDCRELCADRAAADRFADRHRELLRIPQNTEFDVQPCRVRSRAPSRSRSQDTKRDLVFRVAWDVGEEHDLGSRFTSQWQYRAGTTLVLDWDTGAVLSVLTTDHSGQHADRDRTLRRWIERGLLKLREEAAGGDPHPPADRIIAENRNGLMHTINSARALCS